MFLYGFPLSYGERKGVNYEATVSTFTLCHLADALYITYNVRKDTEAVTVSDWR